MGSQMLTDYQKRKRGNNSSHNQIENNPDDFCTHFVTMGDIWIYHFDPEFKEQSSGNILDLQISLYCPSQCQQDDSLLVLGF